LFNLNIFLQQPGMVESKNSITGWPQQPVDTAEMVRVDWPFEYIPLRNVIARSTREFFFDYSAGSSVTFDDDIQAPDNAAIVRRIYSVRHTPHFRWVGKAKTIRADLEIKEYGRDYLLNNFVNRAAAADILPIRSLPLMCFSDGFGLYRSMWKSFMGIYLQHASLRSSEAERQSNIIPVTLGPHGSNFHDVITTLEPIRVFDRGLKLLINGQVTFVCGFVMAFTSDMPQQQTNSGCLGPTANQGCRSCTADSSTRHDLDFDITQHARGHFELLRQRKHLGLPATKAARAAFSKKHGIADCEPAVARIAPALDLVYGRPGDAAHAEFGGITKMAHQVLMEQASCQRKKNPQIHGFG
jgi:hypothetical protein